MLFKSSLLLGSSLRALLERLYRVVEQVYQAEATSFDPRWFGLFYAIEQQGPASVTELAGRLGLTHPAVSVVVSTLEADGWIERRVDEADRRRRLIALTTLGRSRLEKLQPLWSAIEEVMQRFLDDAAPNFLGEAARLFDALDEEALGRAILERAAFHRRVEITGFAAADADTFARLNRAWLEHHFSVEPHDEKVLGDPSASVVAVGGTILCARDGATVAGVVAVVPAGDHEFEICKLAVDVDYRRRGVGEALTRAALRWAKEQGATRVFLFTSPELKAAEALYLKVGFRPVPLSELPPLHVARPTYALAHPM